MHFPYNVIIAFYPKMSCNIMKGYITYIPLITYNNIKLNSIKFNPNLQQKYVDACSPAKLVPFAE